MRTQDSPLVSVILPTFNRAHLVERSARSVLDQTFGDLELIVVDDGSSDETREVISSLTDPRVRYLRHENNMGLSAARNTGIRAAKGRYVAFQDSDDLWLPGKLERQVAVLEDQGPELGVAYCRTLSKKGNHQLYVPSDKIRPKEGRVYDRLLRGNFLTVISALVRRECFTDVGLFDEDLPSLEDWEMWLRVSRKYAFAYIADPLVTVYFTENSLTANTDNFIRARLLILDRHREEFNANRKALAKNHVQLASSLLLASRRQEGRRYALTAWRDWPLDARPLVLAMLGFLGTKQFAKLFDLYMKTK